MVNNEAKPFVKWAGGKRGLIETYENKGFFIDDFNNYYEPMVGAGAIFFHIKQKYSSKKCILSDINKDLIEVYKTVKNDVEELINELSHIKKEYEKEDRQQEFYYGMRQYFNTLKVEEREYHVLENLVDNSRNIENIEDLNEYFSKVQVNGKKKGIRKAALFIFLNKTCYNGLYRVNSKGEFNVPYGRYKNPGIFSPNNLRKVSKLLKGVTLYNLDFEKLLFKENEPSRGDFVYFDPPYIPLTETADFTSYSESGFNHEDQKRLADTVEKLAENGCYVMESNSGSPITKKLYQKYDNLDIFTVEADRYISCKGDERDSVEEVVILGNYCPKPKQQKLPLQE